MYTKVELVEAIQGRTLNINPKVTADWNIVKPDSTKSCHQPRGQKSLVCSNAVCLVLSW